MYKTDICMYGVLSGAGGGGCCGRGRGISGVRGVCVFGVYLPMYMYFDMGWGWMAFTYTFDPPNPKPTTTTTTTHTTPTELGEKNDNRCPRSLEAGDRGDGGVAAWGGGDGGGVSGGVDGAGVALVRAAGLG